MTITRVGVGAVAHGSTSIAPAYPAGYTAVAGDLAVIVVASGHTTVGTIPAASNYQSVGTAAHTGANPTFGLDTGPRRITFLMGQLAASQAAPTVTLATGNVLSAYVLIYRSSVSGANLQVATAFGADDTSAIGVSSTTGTLNMAPGDELIQAWTVTPDTATLSAFTRTATGMTFGTVGTLDTAANTTGNQLGIGYIQMAVATGTSTVAITSGATTSAAASGETGFMRIREGAAISMSNTLEGGTNGTTITIANSGGGSGNAFDFITTSLSGASFVYQNAAAFRGNLGGRLTIAATAGIFLIERVASLSGFQGTAPMYMRFRVRAPSALPAVDIRLGLVADGAGAFCCDVRLTTLGKLELRTGTGTLVGSSTATYAAGQWIDLAFAILKWGTTNGQVELKLYDSAGAVTQTITSAATIDTLRSGGLNKIQFGVLTSTSNLVVEYDDTALSTTGYPVTPTPVSSTLDLRWQVGNVVASDLDLRWAVLAQVAGSLDLRWGVRSTVAAPLDLRWAVANQVSGTLDLRWAVLSTVSSAVDLRWRVWQVTSNALDLRWTVRNLVSSGVDLRWAVRSSVGSALDLRWISYALAGADLDLRWNSAGAGIPVSSALDLRWAVRNTVQAALDARWAVRETVSAPLDLRWRQFALVANALGLRWVVLGLLSDVPWPSDVVSNLTPRIAARADGPLVYRNGAVIRADLTEEA